jgi:ribosomal protein S27E
MVDFSGIGGDDKCGVYIALALLTDLPACKAAFFRDEEIGTVGAGLAQMEFFDDCAFALQADRRGSEDVVFTAGGVEMTSRKFQDALLPIMHRYHRRVELHGALTDVMTLKENGLPICAINASAGYHRPHNAREYVVIREVMATKRLFRDICTHLGDRQWVHSAPKRVYAPVKGVTKGGKFHRYDDYDDGYGYGYGLWADTRDYPVTVIRNGQKFVKMELAESLTDAWCPECTRSQLFWDEKAKQVWCLECNDWARVIVEELLIADDAEQLALPSGEGQG